MKKLLLSLPLVAAVFAASCVKVAQENVFKNDATATLKMTMGYKLDAIEGIKGLIEQAGGGGEDGEDGPTGKIDDALKEFDEKKIVEGLKKSGVEVAKSATVEKDGWKSVEVEGVIKNVNEWVKKSAEAAAEKGKEAMGDGPSMNMPFAKMTPKFYKTDKADVAKFVIIPPMESLLGENGPKLDQLDEMDDEMKEMVEQQINMVRGMISLDDMRVEMKMKVPGKIISVKGAKQEGDDGFIFTMKGSDIGIDSIKNMMGLKEGVYATFQFDPKEFKIELKDEPKAAESKPAKPVEEPKKEKKNEEEKKGGEGG